MKTRWAALLLLTLLLLCACAPVTKEVETQKQVYASFYPIYALTGMALQNTPELGLKCLVQPQDGCLRDYELSDWDLYMLSADADSVVVGGRGLESFESSLYSLGENGPALITAESGLTLYNQSDETETTEDSSHLDGANPHLYLSVSGARNMTAQIAGALCKLYPQYAESIAAGAEQADEQLQALYDECQELCAGTKGEKVILMNEALIYPAVEYGLQVASWYDRESGSTLYGEPLKDALADFEKLGARVILIEKQAPVELTRALTESGFRVVLLDTLSSYSQTQGWEGYFSAQRGNAQAIRDAFQTENED